MAKAEGTLSAFPFVSLDAITFTHIIGLAMYIASVGLALLAKRATAQCYRSANRLWGCELFPFIFSCRGSIAYFQVNEKCCRIEVHGWCQCKTGTSYWLPVVNMGLAISYIDYNTATPCLLICLLTVLCHRVCNYVRLLFWYAWQVLWTHYWGSLPGGSYVDQSTKRSTNSYSDGDHTGESCRSSPQQIESIIQTL